MSETRTEVRPVEIDYVCDACGVGHMRSTGISLMSSPPQYPHKCDKCGAEQTFTNARYPRVMYEKREATASGVGGNDAA
jgi:hypothetical protein